MTLTVAHESRRRADEKQGNSWNIWFTSPRLTANCALCKNKHRTPQQVPRMCLFGVGGWTTTTFEISQHFILIYKKLEQELNLSPVCCMLDGWATTRWKTGNSGNYWSQNCFQVHTMYIFSAGLEMSCCSIQSSFCFIKHKEYEFPPISKLTFRKMISSVYPVLYCRYVLILIRFKCSDLCIQPFVIHFSSGLSIKQCWERGNVMIGTRWEIIRIKWTVLLMLSLLITDRKQ